MNKEEKIVKCQYKGSVNKFEPIAHRRYTFLEKENADNLVVALRYDSRNSDSYRNEVLGEWAITDGNYTLYFHINVQADANSQCVAVRNAMIRSSLPEKIKKIIRADINLINEHEYLKDSAVIIYFKSANAYYNKVEQWGCINDYLLDVDIKMYTGKLKEVEFIKVLMKPMIVEKLKELFGFSYEGKVLSLEIKEFKFIEFLKVFEVEVDAVVKEDDEDILYKASIKAVKDNINLFSLERVNN
ncbi:MAG: staygreen family protein [Sarcina sp.]